MPVVAIIFNGIHFYLPVATAAFARAKQSNGKVVAVFLKAVRENGEGYGFPSDLNLAENLTTTTDADNDDRKIIESNMRLLEHQAIMDKVELTTQLMEDPSPQAFAAVVAGCEKIFVQGNDEGSTPAGIDVKSLIRAVTIPLEIVP
jgi:hypothetical protein